MNPFVNIKNLFAAGLLREAKKRIDKEGRMAKREKYEQGYQLDLVEPEVLIKSDKGVSESEAVLAEITLPQEFIKAEKNLEWLGFFTPSTSRGTNRKVDEKVISFTTTVEGGIFLVSGQKTTLRSFGRLKKIM